MVCKHRHTCCSTTLTNIIRKDSRFQAFVLTGSVPVPHRCATPGQADYETFTIAHGDLAIGKIQVFDAQAQAFDQTQARAVQQPGDELVDARQGGDDDFDLIFGQDGGQVRLAPREILCSSCPLQ